jgi:REP element-mobilizing transposase RayT
MPAVSNESEHHHRRSIRLQTFDYRTPGLYVVTICTKHRLHLFGSIVDDAIVVSPPGEMVRKIWDEIPMFYPDVDIDAFVVMPNHVHGIIVLPSTKADLYPTAAEDATTLVGATPCGCPLPPKDPAIYENPGREPSPANVGSSLGVVSGQKGQPPGVAPTRETGSQGDESAEQGRLSLPDVVHRFKTLTTYRYGEGVKAEGWPRYQGRLWQRNYYERVVRDEAELAKFRAYIENNPARWFEDPYCGE